MEQKEKKNILLLSMSTLNGSKNDETMIMTISKSYYKVENTDIEFTGYSQLEPVPKFLISQKKLDMILVLATSATTNPPKKEQSPQKDDAAEEGEYSVVLEGKETKPEKCSAMDVFTAGVKEYAKEDIKIISIDLDENALHQGISEAVKKLREYNDQYDMSLYMDIHGGPRDQQQITEAILSLLETENIVPQQVYTVDTQGKPTPSSPGIIKRKSAFDVFRFVSGMSEFIQYGRADTLSKYLKYLEKNDLNKNSIDIERRKGLIETIKKIADAIQLCDIVEFEEQLGKMNDWLQMPEEEWSKDFFGIFKETMEKGYGDLLGERRDALKELKWCVKKGFYQQALTIIESRMPEYICENFMIHNGKPFIESNINDEWCKEIDDIKYNAKKKWQKRVNYVFEECIGQTICMDKNIWKKKKKRVFKWYIPLLDGKNKEDYFKKFVKPNEKVGVYKAEVEQYKNESPMITWELKVTEKINDEEKKKLHIFLKLHMALKDQRNKVNHASSEKRAPVEKIFAAINAYIEMVELFTKNCG